MATLADLTPGEQFLMACQVISVDAVNGIALSLFGPASAQAANATITPTGAMSGQLLAAANQIPVNVVTGLVPVSVGDILSNNETGETSVCRWSQITPDGQSSWSSSPSHRVVYAATGWTVIGHIDL